MSNEDLLGMLDLEGKEAPPTREALPITSAGEGQKAAPASPTALRRGRTVSLARPQHVRKRRRAAALEVA